MIPGDPGDVWTWTTTGVVVDETQDALRGMTLSAGSQRRTDGLWGGTSRTATVTPGTTRRTN